MPTSPSASWVAECAACHHSNPVRAHFCSVCGAPLQSPAAAAAAAARAAKAGASAAPDAATADLPEPQGFMLHFNDDDSLAIAPRYTSPDAGDADTAAASGAARTQPHAEFRFTLPGPQPQDGAPAATPENRVNWSNATVAGAMLVITALVGSGSYLLGRSSVAPPLPLASYQAATPATAAALGTAPAALPPPVVQNAALQTGAAQPTAAQPPGHDSLAQAQQALAQADAATGRAAVAPLAPALPVAAAAPATTVAQAAPAARKAPVAAPVPGMVGVPGAVAPAAGAARAPAAMPCNATVAALGLCEP